MHGPLLLAAVSLPQMPVTPDEAIARQQQEVHAAIETSPCRAGATDEEIVVCGRIYQPGPITPDRRYDAPRDFAVPQAGPWFEFRRGGMTFSCCSVPTANGGTAAGIGLRIAF
jgi:hypothetical protein